VPSTGSVPQPSTPFTYVVTFVAHRFLADLGLPSGGSTLRNGPPPILAPMPAPFGWDPVGFWVTTLTLGATALILGIGVPLSMRRWNRTDVAERERIASVLSRLAGDLDGAFVGPRDVMGVNDDGEEYGPVLDYGTALVRSADLAVEVGVQVMGGPRGKCLKLRVALPEGRAWSVAWLRERFQVRRGDPRALRTFRRAFRSADPEGLTVEARVALLSLAEEAAGVELSAEALTVWALPPSRRASARIDGVTDAMAVLPHVHRTAAVARLLLQDR